LSDERERRLPRKEECYSMIVDVWSCNSVPFWLPCVQKSRLPSSSELQQQQLLKQDRGVMAMEGAANSNLSIFASSHSAR
jgi:hypothetical protein